MNYVGSISILDRGDAPAQAVIDRNARSLAQRMADETKQELEKVLTRVETIYSSFEDRDQLYSSSHMEYLHDISELEELMKDQVKKKKYQQQVTIFIVGYSDVCGQKLRLIQQVNEFFSDNSKKLEEEDWFPTTPDIDLDEISEKIDDSLQVAHDLSKRLGELNKEMIEYLANNAEKKASNKGKKKMEKALGQARDEVQTLAEKLLAAQAGLEEKEEKLQSTFIQLELKNLEVQKYRTAAELAKKALKDSGALQEEIAARDAKLLEQRQQLTRMEMELAHSNFLKEHNQTKAASMGEETKKILLLQKELDDQKRTAEEVKRDLDRLQEDELKALKEAHQQAMEEMKKQHTEQIKSLTGVSDNQSETGKQFDPEAEDAASGQGSKQPKAPVVIAVREKRVRDKQKESRSSTKDKSSKAAAAKKAKGGKGSTSGTNKEQSEVATQDEGGDPGSAVIEESKVKTGTRHGRRSKSTLAPVEEFGGFEDAYDLSDEQAWVSVPKDQLQGRFAQYRRMCQIKLQEAEEERQLTVAKTQRKVQLLKAQFVEHKNKWESERKILIEQIEQSHQLQTDAEKEADEAMTQLEDFITEQEKLEEEEDLRRSAILRGLSSASLSHDNLTPVAKTPQQVLTPAGGTTFTQPTPPESRVAQNSEEALNLLQQTDDAKVEELRGRLTGIKSAPPDVDVTATTIDHQMVVKESTVKSLDIEEQSSDMEHTVKPMEEASKLGELEDHTADDDVKTLSIQPPPSAAPSSSLLAFSARETAQAETSDISTASSDKDKHATSIQLKEGMSLSDINQNNVTKSKENTGLAENLEESSLLVEGNLQAVGVFNTNTSLQSGKAADTDTIIKFGDDIEAELREVSARSRASLRNQYKIRLQESRQAAEDRRSKSPLITLPSKLFLDDELVLDDEDDEFDEDIDLPDDLKEELGHQKKQEVSLLEIGTSPPPKASSYDVSLRPRKSSKLLSHPLLSEYLKIYSGIAGFKDTVSSLFLDKDMMSASQILADLETLVFNQNQKVMPQVEQLTANSIFILEEISSVISNTIMVDTEPPVSSLLPYSRDEMRSRLPPTREASEDVFPACTHHRTDTPASAAEQMDANSLTNKSRIVGGGTDSIETTSAVRRKTEEPVRHDSNVTVDDGSEDTQPLQTEHESIKSSTSESTKHYLADLQARCSVLQKQLMEENKKHEEQLRQKQLMEENKKHEEQLRHNTVVMMEMQDTINELQRELSSIGKSARKPWSAPKTPSPDQTLMFTRLDRERNAKIMKKAVMDQRLAVDKFKEVVTTMDDYVDLPAQRLNHLVKKYVHHSRMKEIEENVKNSRTLDEQVYDTLDKMEALQNQRARSWAEKMDVMGIERLKLAAILMDSLDNIEQESGLFLIKPMYSYRGRALKAPPTQKLARPLRTQPVSRHISASHQSIGPFNPAPTPASYSQQFDRQTTTKQLIVAFPPSRPEVGVVGSGAIGSEVTAEVSKLTQSYPTWNLSASHALSPRDNTYNHLNTPRMLELDINRMLIGQNNISTQLPHPPTDDRLLNANNNNLRSYITIQRPSASMAVERPHSSNGTREIGVPPSSPSLRHSLPLYSVDHDLPSTISSSDPLPPIKKRGESVSSVGHMDLVSPASSAAAASTCQTTPLDIQGGTL